MVRARVIVFLKQDVMDPQGNAVGEALASLGHKNVKQTRVGRAFDLQLEGDTSDVTREQVKSMCEALLANTVIERYEIALETMVECRR